MNKKINRALTAGVITFSLAASLMQTPEATAASAKINKKKATLSVGKTCKLKVTGCSGTISWKSSNKKVATVNKKGLVQANKAGTAKITAKARSKKWSCKITVKKRYNKPIQPAATAKPDTTPAPVKPNTAPAAPISTKRPTITVRPSTTLAPASTKRPTMIIRPNMTLTPAAPTNKPTAAIKPSTTPAPIGSTGTSVTEQSAYATLNSLRSTYPEGMTLTNSYYYYSPRFGNGYGCYGFAAKLSDTVFGTEQPYQTHSSFDNIRVGDNIRIGNSHSVIVLTKESNYITVVEGNYNSSVHWDRKITSASLTSSGFKVYTRY